MVKQNLKLVSLNCNTHRARGKREEKKDKGEKAKNSSRTPDLEVEFIGVIPIR